MRIRITVIRDDEVLAMTTQRFDPYAFLSGPGVVARWLRGLDGVTLKVGDLLVTEV